MDKIEKIFKTVALILITALVTIILTTNYIIKREKNSNEDLFGANLSSTQFSKLKGVYGLIKNTYYKEVSDEDLEEAAIAGMLEGLDDPYSYYMNAEEYSAFNEETSGNYTGIGLYLRNNAEKNVIEVISPIKDTPAYKADIKTGDYIVAVDDVIYEGNQMSQAVKNIKGEAGTSVKITIVRDNEEIEKTLKREDINILELEYEVLSNNIGYINIKLFDKDVSTDFEKAYNELMKKNIKGLIIDVRDNPGGLLSEVVKISDMLVPEGLSVYTVDAQGNRKDYTSDAKKIEIPLVVLVNDGSASASEILAGAVKDHGVGTIVGITSYGKGLVQTVRQLNNNDAIKITTSEYFTPNGNKINEIGVVPDVEIDLTDELKKKIILTHSEDIQLQKAIEVIKK